MKTALATRLAAITFPKRGFAASMAYGSEPDRVLAPFAKPFLALPESFILDADRLAQCSA